MGIRTR